MDIDMVAPTKGEGGILAPSARGLQHGCVTATAARLALAGSPGSRCDLPTRSSARPILCFPGPREWSDEDIAVAAVLADLVNSYVVNASELRQQ